jgi:exonuclease III
VSGNGPWGDKLKNKALSTFRYCFVNINGLPAAAHKEKHDRITTTIEKQKIDILGLAEININFKQTGPTNQWKDRFKKLRTNSHSATNIHTTAKEKQVFGGTAYLTSKSTSNRVEAKGEDPQGLGRWTWALLSGRRGIKARIISGYRPVKDQSNKTATVFSQHEQYFYDQGAARNPRQAFLDDLGDQIKKWKADGNLIILGLDLNDNAWNSAAAQTIESWGLLNVHTSHHPELPPTATCNKNRSNTPIDGIWCSPGIEIDSAGMTGFGSPDLGKTDHRLLWADFTFDSLFGYRPPHLAAIQQTGIPLKDPELAQRLNAKLSKERKKHNIPNQIIWLEQRAHSGQFDREDAKIFDALIALDDEIRAKCKQSIRKKLEKKSAYGNWLSHAS